MSFPRYTSSREQSERRKWEGRRCFVLGGSRLLGCPRESLRLCSLARRCALVSSPRPCVEGTTFCPDQRSGSSRFSLGIISCRAAALKEGKEGWRESARPTMKNRKLSQRSVIQLLPPPRLGPEAAHGFISYSSHGGGSAGEPLQEAPASPLPLGREKQADASALLFRCASSLRPPRNG